MSRFLAIHESGYPLWPTPQGPTPLQDAAIGRQIFSNLKYENRALQTNVDGEQFIVEPFDQVFVAQHVHKSSSGEWFLQLAYQMQIRFEPKHLLIDEWDRFLGYTDPNEYLKDSFGFVLSDIAQEELFDLVDSFDDDSITIDGKKHELRPWLCENPEVEFSNYWSKIYQTEEPGWEMNAPTPILRDTLTQLKLQKSRVVVLGCGSGNDAAFLAQAGNLVTAVDFSEVAIAQAKQKYGQIENLEFVQADTFQLPAHMMNSFDLVFDHTHYCAINPSRRSELLTIWRKLLVDGGNLLGIFFSMDTRSGPPYGGSEWELRKRLHKKFQPIYWNRCHNSHPRRLGREFLIYAQKL